MPKITLIGAGSVIFSKNIISDCLSYPELAGSTFALFDIDEGRLRTAEKMAHQVATAWNAHPTITATQDPWEALGDADYAVFMFQVGGYEPSTVIDFEIPKKYGLRQTIGDTLGIGGIFRALRTIPVMLDYGYIMEEVCPEVTLLNYVNPMAMNTWACWPVRRSTPSGSVTACRAATVIWRGHRREPGRSELHLRRHQPYGLLSHPGAQRGRSVPAHLRQGRSGEYCPEWDRVRLDMMLRLGYYITESSEHFSEYGPWYIKRDRPELITDYHIPLDEYPRRCIAQNKDWNNMAADLEAGKGFGTLQRSSEYGSRIIHAMETGEPTIVHGNVMNNGLISNLPEGCCVEVPCLIDKNGIQPIGIGDLPPHLAGLNRTNINVQELVVAAALTDTRGYVYHAAMLDPHTGAELACSKSGRLVDDLLEAHGDMIPLFKENEHGHDCECGCH